MWFRIIKTSNTLLLASNLFANMQDRMSFFFWLDFKILYCLAKAGSKPDALTCQLRDFPKAEDILAKQNNQQHQVILKPQNSFYSLTLDSLTFHSSIFAQ